MLYSGNLLDERNGRPIEGAEVWVYNSSNVEATLTDSLGQPLTQPLRTGADGEYEYMTDDVVYRTDFWKNSIKIYRQNNLYIDKDIIRYFNTLAAFQAQPTTTGVSYLNGVSYSWRPSLPAGIVADNAIFVASDISGFWVRASRDIESFLPPKFDWLTYDISAAVSMASLWSSANDIPVRYAGKYLLANVALIANVGTKFMFEDATFLVRDDGATVGRKSAPAVPMHVGMYIGGNRTQITGRASFYSQDVVPGVTNLIGMFIDEADDVRIGETHLSGFGFGQFFWCCDRPQVGDTTAYLMWGTQIATDDGGGSAQVLAGTRYGKFGSLDSQENDKPFRYLSIGAHSTGGPRDNFRNHFGTVTGRGRTNSPWAQGYGIRSAVDCTFDDINVTNVAYGINAQKYGTKDDNYNIDGLVFNHLTAQITRTTSSVDAGIKMDLSTGTKNIGSIDIKSARLIGPSLASLPTVFGIFIDTGRLRIGELYTEGFTSGFQIMNAKLTIDNYQFNGSANYVGRVFNGSDLTIDRLDIQRGFDFVAPPGAVRVENTLGVGAVSVNIGPISYALNGAAFAPAFHVYADPVFTFNEVRVSHVNQPGTSGEVRYVGAYQTFPRDGRVIANTIPTVTTSPDGFIVYNRTPSIGEAIGWVSISAVWQPFGVSGMVRAAAPAVTYTPPNAATFVTPTGGTPDVEGRLALGQLATDVASIRTALGKLPVDLGDLRTKLQTAIVTA